MTLVNANLDKPEAVTLMQAAVLACVHVTNVYKLRNKLGAFKRDGVWYIPTDSLQHYIQRRKARAQAILASAADAGMRLAEFSV
jgi:hypothetical protein